MTNREARRLRRALANLTHQIDRMCGPGPSNLLSKFDDDGLHLMLDEDPATVAAALASGEIGNA